MAEVQEVNVQALHVVGRELATTLNDARTALEATLEQPGDAGPLKQFVDLVSQARGVLHVVEIYGGALLAEEMEQTARFLSRGVDARQRAEALDALMRAVVQLPTYLERVLGGARDFALVLLPLLNDLRAIRGASLLSEGTLLSLNLTSERQPSAEPRVAADDKLALLRLARRLRGRFQIALLGVIRGDDDPSHLAVLADVAEQMEAAASTAPVFQLWWVVGAVVEGLRAGGLEKSASIKRLLGQADRELLRLYQQGEDRYADAPPLDLLNNLLFYVARSTTEGPRIATVRSSFRLTELLPVDETVAQEQESLSGPSVKLMHTVAAAIKDDLGRVKDALDLFTRKGGQLEELAPQVELLRKIGDTLAVLGLGSLREKVQTEIGRLAALVSRNIPAERDTLIGIAAALINVEDSLDDALVHLVMPPGAPQAGVIQDPEFRQVAGAVLRECAVNMSRIKELVTQAMEPDADVAGMDAVPQLSRGVTAGLLMLGKSRAMEIMDRTSKYIVELLGPGAEAPDSLVIDRLADAVVGLEYYMETLQAGRGDAWYMLDNAERCLAAIEAQGVLPRDLAQPDAAAAAPAVPEPVAVPRPPTPPAAQPIELPPPAETPLPPAQPPPAAPAVRPPVAVPAAATEDFAAAADELDPELLGIFVEESRDEVAAVEQALPRWIENPADRESLSRARRAFHTMKGSGRMVGAMALGEFAWAVENLLNRLIDGTRERSQQVVEVLQESMTALPGMLQAVERRAVLPAGSTALAARLHAIAAGESAPAAKPAVAAARPEAPGPAPAAAPEDLRTGLFNVLDAATMARMQEQLLSPEPAVAPAGGAGQASPAPEPVVAKAAPEPPVAAIEADTFEPEPEADDSAYAAMDPSLQDIFRKEVQTHLDAFRDFLRRAWVTAGPHHVSEDLYRACHTLRGASRTAESQECISLSDPLHRWLRRLFDSGRPFDDAGLTTLADAVAAFEDVVDGVTGDDQFLHGLNDVIQRIAELDLALEESIAAEQAATEALGEPTILYTPPPSEAAGPPAAEGPFDLQHLIPEISVDAATGRARPGAGYERLLPPQPGEQSVDGEIPYLSKPQEPQAPPAAAAPPPVATPASAVEATTPASQPSRSTSPPEPAEKADVTAAAPAADYDAEIAAIFSDEATELLETADSVLGALRAERGGREQVVELQRALHTIKGGARMAGIRSMGDLSHEIESLLIQIGNGSVPLDERAFDVLQASLDELNRMRDFVNAGRAVSPARDLITRIQLVSRGAVPAPVIEQPQPPPPSEPRELAAAAPDEVAADEPAALEAADEEPPSPMATETATSPGTVPPGAAPVLPGREVPAERADIARVDADLLDTMLNNAGEVSIYRARLEQQLGSIDFNLAELARVVQRLKEQLRKLEIETEAQILHRHVDQVPRRTDFDPLELDRYSAIQQYSRGLGETASDVASIQGLLGNLTREAQNLLIQQGRIVSDLQDSLMRTRMVPFQRHVQRLTRIVRQSAAEQGKRADLVVSGASGELDRQVLDRMLAPLEHLVRNAVVHGIELPEQRAARGKPEAGSIALSLKREGSEVVITVADDGTGINLRAVREKAAAMGIVQPKQELSDEQAKQLILEPGFTTAAQVTQSAGRGVGLDVVATEIKKLGGALFIDSEEGRGTTFTVRLPFTLAISQALVVRAGDEFFALPLPTIEGVVRVPEEEVQRQLASDSAGFEYGGQHYRFQHLSGFVGNDPAPPAEHDPAVPVILVRAGEHSTGIVTDELIGSREIVVKSVGPQISGIRGISGATILGDGRICIILDVGALVRSDWRQRTPGGRPLKPRTDERVFALVVDDSITVRRVTQRLLERNGMRVMTAKDGLDAIGMLQDHVPDVILLDIEMPRMDGYEVASHVRNDPRLKDVPIVMITSRVGEKHRARAIELGVNEYLGKPYQETQLMQALEPLLRKRRSA